MIFDTLMDHKTSTRKITLVTTIVTNCIVTSIKDFGTLPSCFLYCISFNSYVKFSSALAPDTPCYQIPIILPFS